MPSGVASVHRTYTTQVARLREYAERDHQALRLKEAPVYYWPEDSAHPVSIHDPASFGKPYDREEIHQDFRDAVRGGSQQGAAGDFSVVVVQGDFLASLERAFRMRHLGPVRARLHAAGRRRGHGHVNGVYSAGLSTYLTEIELEAKGG